MAPTYNEVKRWLWELKEGVVPPEQIAQAAELWLQDPYEQEVSDVALHRVLDLLSKADSMADTDSYLYDQTDHKAWFDECLFDELPRDSSDYDEIIEAVSRVLFEFDPAGLSESGLLDAHAYAGAARQVVSHRRGGESFDSLARFLWDCPPTEFIVAMESVFGGCH